MHNLHQKLAQKYPAYHQWHQTKHHNKIHWGVLVGFVLVVFSLIFNSVYDAAGNESGQSLLISAVTQPSQQTLSLEPAADTYVSSSEKNANFGSATKLRVYAWVIEPLLRFDLSSIPANATILSADLSVVFESYDYEDFDPKIPQRNFTIYDVNKDFVENQATYINYATGATWESEGLGRYKDYYVLPYSQSIPVSSVGQYSSDVTSLIKQLRNQGTFNANIVLMSFDASNPSGYIYSREYSDPVKRPKLTVNYSLTTPQARVGDDIFLTDAQWTNPVTVDGSASSLPDGSKTGLAYLWTMDKPAPGSSIYQNQELGASAILSFNPDKPGSYTLRLKVTNSNTSEFTEDTTEVTVGLKAHPRLHIDQSLLSQIKALKEANDPVWTRFYNWVKYKPTYSDLTDGLVTSYMLTYLVTGESQYFDWTWDSVKGSIYKNGLDSSGGFKTLVDLYGDDHDRAFMGGALVARIALFFDWGYDRLDDTQKEDIIYWINEANKYNYLYNSQAKLYFRNDGVIVTHGLAAGVYATLGDNSEAITQLGWFKKNWRELMSALDIIGKGGAMPEGNAYGAGTAGTLIRIANLVYYSSGEDLFLSHQWFKQRLLYDAFAAYPGVMGGPDSPVQYGYGGPSIEEASIGGDGRRGYSFASLPLRPNGLILSRRFAGTEEANIWNWVHRQPNVDQMLVKDNSFPDVLFYSPKPNLVKPTKLSHFDPSIGYVYIRSDWDSPDSTWLSFWAGPHLDTHQHLDQGGFTIFKRRDLAPKTGHMDKNSVFSEHHLSYYTRTVSSNGILIGNPNEIYTGFIAGGGCDKNGAGSKIATPDNSGDVCIPNDGGQRTFRPFGMAVGNANQFNTYRDIFDTARIISFDDQGSYVSIVADITNAYNNPRYSTPGNAAKVNKVYRRLVYVRDLDLLLIGDTVESTNANFEKKWLLHSLDQLNIEGDVQTIQEGEEVYTNTGEAKIVVDDTKPSDKDQKTFDMRKGYSSLLLKTLFPAQFQYRKIGGREPSNTQHADMYKPDSYGFNFNHLHRHINDFYIKDFSEGVIPNHKSANWLPEGPIEVATSVYDPIFRGGYGRYRLELEPTVPAMTDYFLNVLKPSLDTNAVMPQSTKIETATTFGAEIISQDKKYSITFTKETLDKPVIEITSLVPDTTPPSIPTNLQAVTVSSAQINLSWAASTDNIGVSGYKIYRDNTLVTSLQSPVVSYSDTGLQPQTTYSYTVSAFDAAGNESAKSTPLSVTTLAAFKQSDLNQDGKTDQLDFDILKQDYNRTDKPKSDLNQDGIVDSRDLGILMSEWTR